MFLVNRVQLADQMSDHLNRAKISHGIIQGSNTRSTYSDCVIASIDTIHARGYPEVNLIICDEIHGAAGSKKYLQLIEHYKDIPIIGVTATSFVKGLGKQYSFGRLFEDVVRAITIPELIEQGFLVDVDIYAPCDPDLKGVKIVAGDYQEEQLAAAMDKPQLVGDIIKTWNKLARGKQTIVFAVDIAHSMHIVEQFNKNGVSAEHIDYKMDYEEKKSIVKRFKNREFTVLSNCSLLAEGFDAPATEVMILARPTRNLKRYMQMAGRVLRIFEGKQSAIILDHSGSTKQLGYPTEYREVFLCDGKPKTSSGSENKEKKEFELSKCSQCDFLRKKSGKCPICGHLPIRQSEVETIDGELKIMTKKEKAKKAKIDGLDKQNVYSELTYMANERGYKSGWIANQYRSIFGVWPKGLQDTKRIPSLQVQNMVKAAMIRFHKGNKNAEA
jgi:superfamily II DNA or RNA helicase